MNARHRKRVTQKLLDKLKSMNIADTEIAFRTNACIQSIWRWRAGSTPTPAYFDNLVAFAKEKGVEVENAN
jgi:hypothetical protein